MAYSLLIVDDEAEIVDWLVTMFNEEKIPNLEVYGVYSAKQAINLLESMKIDIVLSDIKMPEMTGLELMEKIKSYWPICRIIFLTGFNEFDYVYTAIQNDGVRYLLKNEKDEVVIDAVKTALNDIELKLKDNEIIMNAKQHMDKMIPLLQKEFFQDLISGFYDLNQLTQERLDELSLPFKANNSCMMIFGRFDTLPPIKSISLKNKNIYSVKHIAEKFLPATYSTICFTDGDSGLIWIVQPEALDQKDGSNSSAKAGLVKPIVLLEGSLEYIQTTIKNTLGLTMSFAISSKTFGLDTVPEIYSSLKTSLGYHIGLAKEIILSDEKLEVSDLIQGIKEDNAIQSSLKEMGKLKILENCIESAQKNHCLALLKVMLESLRAVKSRNSNSALEIYYSVALTFLKIINRWNITGKVAFKIGLHKLTRADEHKSWDEAVEYLYQVAKVIFEIQEDEETKRISDTVTRVKLFICENISQDLTLKRLSDLVHVNSSYLSRLFKQETGSNITEFVEEMRIDKAKNLLRFSSKKINEIANEVGYDSHNSFGRFFRNAVGFSPQEYRESVIDNLSN